MDDKKDDKFDVRSTLMKKYKTERKQDIEEDSIKNYEERFESILNSYKKQHPYIFHFTMVNFGVLGFVGSTYIRRTLKLSPLATITTLSTTSILLIAYFRDLSPTYRERIEKKEKLIQQYKK
eukprot:gene5835-9658_t